MRVIGIIPARYAATRLNGKVLADIDEKPMIQHVYERAVEAQAINDVVIATDDQRVVDAANAFDARCEMTSSSHTSGTDRVAEVARNLQCDVIVNIQGDEPMIDPSAIDAAVEPFAEDSQLRMSTLATPIDNVEEHREPSTVKVVVDGDGYALYFSRAPIPYFRREDEGPWPEDRERRHPVSGQQPLKHIGLYVFSTETLLWFADLEPTALERTEKLEQLRALENGCSIRVVQVQYSPIGVDTPADLERVRKIMGR